MNLSHWLIRMANTQHLSHPRSLFFSFVIYDKVWKRMTRAYVEHVQRNSAHLNSTAGDACLWIPQLTSHGTAGQLLNSVASLDYTWDYICACVCEGLCICEYAHVRTRQFLPVGPESTGTQLGKQMRTSKVYFRQGICHAGHLYFCINCAYFGFKALRELSAADNGHFKYRHFELTGTSNWPALRTDTSNWEILNFCETLILQNHFSYNKLLGNLGIIIIYMKE